MKNTWLLMWLISLISLVCLVGVYFYRLKYLRQAKLHIWGALFVLDIAFLGLAAANSFLMNWSEDVKTQHNFMLSNVLMIFEMALWLIQYWYLRPRNKVLLQIIFATFFVIWCIEFRGNLLKNYEVERLLVSAIFMCMVVFLGSWQYLFGLFKSPFIKYSSNPFFGLVIGWLVYYTLSSTFYFSALTESNAHEDDKIIVAFDWKLLIDIVSNICYIIAFWKTKDWVLKNRTL